MSFFSRWTKGDKKPPEEAVAPTEAAPTQQATPVEPPPPPPPKRSRTEPMMPAVPPQPISPVASSEPPKRTRTAPMIPAMQPQDLGAPPVPAPNPPPKVIPREDLDSTKKSGPDVLVARVVDISTPPPPPPPAKRPEISVSPDVFAPPPPRAPQATVDWTNDPIVVTTDTKPNLGTQAAEARAAVEPPPPSKRPVAPTMDAPKGMWGSDSVESLLDDVDAGFDSILDQGPHTSRDGAEQDKPTSGGLTDARALFIQLAAGHVRHVRDFMIDVLANQAKTDWVGVCQPAIASLREMTKQLAMNEVASALEGFAQALDHAAKQLRPMVDGEARERLIAAYEPLPKAMPTAFTLDDVRSARESVIVQSLLLQIPEVRKVAIDKLYRAGLTSLSVYWVAKAEEITQTTGIEPPIARRIVEKFQRYKKDIEGAKVDAARTFENDRLSELSKSLAKHHAEFEDASDSKEKREARKAREDVWLEVKVLLARLGETERLDAMERMPFSQRVRELESYLYEAKMRAKGQG